MWGQYQINKRLGLRSGLQYMNVGEEVGADYQITIPVTGQRVGYFFQSYSFRVNRFQLPLLAVYEFGKGVIRPYLGIGTIWSQDLVTDIKEEYYDRLEDRLLKRKAIDFSSNLWMDGFQFMATIGLTLSNHYSIEFKHLFRGESKYFKWISSSNNSTKPINNYLLKTEYHKSSSFVFLYKF